MAAAALMTADEFARMATGETEDYELVEGELVPMPSGNPMHGEIRGRIEFLIRGYLQQHRIGRVIAEVDCQLATHSVRRPDLSIFLGRQSKSFDPNRIPVPFAPDIAVEVLSPSESAMDVNMKVLAYIAAGTEAVWVVDTATSEIFIRRQATISLLRGEQSLESPLLPGFSVPVSELLATDFQ